MPQPVAQLEEPRAVVGGEDRAVLVEIGEVRHALAEPGPSARFGRAGGLVALQLPEVRLNAICCSSVRRWPRSTSTAYVSIPASIAAASSRLSGRLMSTPETSPAKKGCCARMDLMDRDIVVTPSGTGRVAIGLPPAPAPGPILAHPRRPPGPRRAQRRFPQS